MQNRRIVFTAPGQVDFEHLDEPPKPAADEFLLETIYSGITNGTERHALLMEHGPGASHYPGYHGYQQVCRVVARGDSASKFEIGDHVFCGDYKGHRGWNLVKEDGLVIKLLEDMDFKYCALLGMAGVAMRAIRRMSVKDGDKVWVVGQDPLGHFAAQTARSVGARVVVSDRNERRLNAARKCGADVVLNAADRRVMDRLADEGPFSFIIDCYSAGNLFTDIDERRLLEHGGVVGMLAVQDQVTDPRGMLISPEARGELSGHFQPDDIGVLINLVRQGTVHLAPIVSHIVPIDEAPGIYDRLANGDEDLLGVVFDWRDA
jgi:2-desacetyl-2-hydroxyethyl bacteriochlorophyllide A dehydrogenase